MSVVEKAIRKLREEQGHAGEIGHSGAPLDGQDSVTTQSAASTSRERLPPIVLERGALRAAGLMPPEEDMGVLTREYRKVKHPLIAQAVGRGAPPAPKGYLIMIASAMAGEGKTFTALNLALSMAREKDIEVLLVDADVSKPQLSHVLNVMPSPGLIDALCDPDLDIESLIRATDVPTLSFLPRGAGAEDATELLASSRMERIAKALGKRRQRIVIFDSPPLLQTTESPALAKVVGQIVVVVRAEFTPQPVLLEALNTLEGHPAVSLLLNQSTRSVDSTYYYYGYGNERTDAGSA